MSVFEQIDKEREVKSLKYRVLKMSIQIDDLDRRIRALEQLIRGR